MADVDVIFLLLALVSIFSLVVVVPTVVVLVMAGVVDPATETMIDHWAPSILEPTREQPDDSTTGGAAAEHPVASVHSDHEAQDQTTGGTPTGLERES